MVPAPGRIALYDSGTMVMSADGGTLAISMGMYDEAFGETWRVID